MNSKLFVSRSQRFLFALTIASATLAFVPESSFAAANQCSDFLALNAAPAQQQAPKRVTKKEKEQSKDAESKKAKYAQDKAKLTQIRAALLESAPPSLHPFVNELIEKSSSILLDSNRSETAGMETIIVNTAPGLGKTTVFQRFVDLMEKEFNASGRIYTMEEGSTHFPVDSIIQQPANSRMSILITGWDEAQKVKYDPDFVNGNAQKNVQPEAQASNDRYESSRKEMLAAAQDDQRRAIKKSRDFLWKTGGNGILAFDNAKIAKDLIKTLEDRLSEVTMNGSIDEVIPQMLSAKVRSQYNNAVRILQKIELSEANNFERVSDRVYYDSASVGMITSRFQEVLSNHIEKAENLLRAAQEAGKPLETDKRVIISAEEIPNYMNQLATLRVDLESSLAKIRRKQVESLEPLATEIVIDLPDLIKGMDVSPRELAEKLVVEGNTLLENLADRSKSLPAQTKKVYNKHLNVIMMNPDPITLEINERFKGRELDPDAYRAEFEKIPDSKIEELYVSIFGKEDGWRSRFPIEAFRPIPPKGRSEYMQDVAFQLKGMQSRIDGSLKEFGLPSIRMDFDYSFHILMFHTAVRPLEGSRSFFKNSRSLMDQLQRSLLSEVLERNVEKKEALPKAVKVRFDSSTKKIVIEGVDSKFVVNIEAPGKLKVPAEQLNLERDGQYYRQAGAAIVGMRYFGSIPKAVSVTENLGMAVERAWEAPNVPHHTYRLGSIRVNLGSYLAELAFAGPTFLSPQSQAAISRAKAELSEIANDVQTRKSQFAWVEGRSTEAQAREILPEAMQDSVIYRELLKGNVDGALEILVADTKQIVREHPLMISKVADTFHHSQTLTSDQLKSIMSGYFTKRYSKWKHPVKAYKQKKAIKKDPMQAEKQLLGDAMAAKAGDSGIQSNLPSTGQGPSAEIVRALAEPYGVTKNKPKLWRKIIRQTLATDSKPESAD